MQPEQLRLAPTRELRPRRSKLKRTLKVREVVKTITKDKAEEVTMMGARSIELPLGIPARRYTVCSAIGTACANQR